MSVLTSSLALKVRGACWFSPGWMSGLCLSTFREKHFIARDAMTFYEDSVRKGAGLWGSLWGGVQVAVGVGLEEGVDLGP